jgi:hypothetical protein
VRKYLRTFATRDLDELRAVVADNVEIYGAGQFVRGRHNVEAAVTAPGLTAEQSFCRMYQVNGGKIVPFWGEADVFGLLRGLGLLPDTELNFA